MKKIIALSIALLSFVTTFAISKDSTVVKTNCFDDVKIKTFDKHYFISFTVKGKDGIIRKGYTGRSLSHGIPDVDAVRADVARKTGARPFDVQIEAPSEMTCSDYHDFFKNKYGKIYFSK